MSTASVQTFSRGLGKWIRYNIILPDVGEGPYPVLLQLHGLSDDCDGWIQRTNILHYVRDYPLVVVMPDGGTSCYLNWKSAGMDETEWPSSSMLRSRWEDAIMVDVVDHVRRTFPVTDRGWAIGGLSMGGGGAMRLGLKYADLFDSIYAHSSKFWWDGFINPARLDDQDDADVRVHARRVAASGRQPAISFDCGLDDRLLEENRRFDAFLTELGLEHRYAEFPGDHLWSYWDAHVQEAIARHAEVLGITRQTPR